MKTAPTEVQTREPRDQDKTKEFWVKDQDKTFYFFFLKKRRKKNKKYIIQYVDVWPTVLNNF